MDVIKNINDNNLIKPLIHNITNYVTINDVANALLAIGASPIMAENEQEIEEITAISQGLNINIGMINDDKYYSMLKAGICANRLKIPVILDLVGVGASSVRRKDVKGLLENIHFTVIKGNISEIKTLYGQIHSHGVDASSNDLRDEIDPSIELSKVLAKQYQCIITITGKSDIISDDKTSYIIHNGHPLMSRISGSGCMLSAITIAYVSVYQDYPLLACAYAFVLMGVAGEEAYKKMKETNSGLSSYKMYLLDNLYLLNDEILRKKAKYEIR